MVDDAWLTTTQAGRMLGLSAATIRTMCNDGRLQCIKPAGTARRISRASIEKHLANAGYKPPPEPTPVLPTPVLRARGPSKVVERIQKKLRQLRSEQPS